MGVQSCFSQCSKEDQINQISKSVFVTNFSDHVRARDLYHVCKAYGTLVDVYIPLKKLQSGKRFTFLPFIKVINLERLIENLCTIWIGSFRLHANMARFERDQNSKNPFPKSSIPDKVINPGNSKGNFYNASYSSKSSGTFASILKGDAQKLSSPDQSKPVLVLDESCIKERDFSKSLVGQVKEVSTIPNLYIVLLKEGFDYVNITYLGGLWVLFEFEALNTMEKFRNHVGLPINSWTSNTFLKVASKWGDLVVWEESEENSLSCKHLCLKTKMQEIINESFKIIIKGKVHWIRAKELHAWIPNFVSAKDSYNSDDEPDAPDEEHKFGDNEFEKPNDDSHVEKVSESSCMHGNDFVHEKASNIHCEEPPYFFDPFNIYDLLQKKNRKFPLSKDSDPIYPPGFTPVSENINKGKGSGSSINQEKSIPEKKQYPSHNMEAPSQRTTSIPTTGGSILEVIDDLVKVGHAMGYNMEGCSKNI
ncbi:RNA-directed DNA polymerase, eukaryota, partial [Tanacetum coccineum]